MMTIQSEYKGVRRCDADTIDFCRKHYGAEYARKVLALFRLARRYACENYGYDWKNYRKILSQRTRALAVARKACELGTADFTACGNSRLIWCEGTGEFSYVVGQSSNEEITNILRQVARVRGGWLS